MHPAEARGGLVIARLSMSAVAVLAVAFLVWLPRPAIPLIDGDVWWHLRAGEEVLQTGRVPTTDSWSIVGEGMRWVSQDWLSNVGLTLGHRLGEWGPTVLSVVFSLLVVGSLVVLWRGIGLRDASVGWFARLVWLTVGLTVAGPVVGVRVQVVDLPMAALTLFILWTYLASRRPLVLAWLPVIAVLWANLHAAWLLIPLLGGAVLIGEAVDQLVGRSVGETPLAWRQLGWLALGILGALAAVSVNPNGPALYAYPFETSAIAAHRDFLAEWSPPDVTTLPGQLFAGFLVLGVLPTLAFGWRRLRTADLLILLGLCLMAGTAARFLLVAGPIGAAIVAIGLAPVISESRIGRALGPSFERMRRPPRKTTFGVMNLVLIAVVAWAGIGITLARVSPPAQEEAIAQHMPVTAVDWIVANDPGDRPFNVYAWGGYLGWRRPDTLVYIDGRSDIYGDAPIRAYAGAISLRTDPAELLDAHRIDHVLFNADHVFADWLNESAAWERVHTDPVASVWVRAR